jgi:hypothetical protein
LNQPKDELPYSSLSPRSNKEQNTVTPKGHYFEICIKGQLSDVWADWFEGMTIKYLDNEEMLFSGYVVDQSALMGILNKLARLNLTLISLKEIKNKKEK